MVDIKASVPENGAVVVLPTSPLPPNSPTKAEMDPHSVQQGPAAGGLGHTLTTQTHDPEYGNIDSYAEERALYAGQPQSNTIGKTGAPGLGKTLTSQDHDPEFGNIKSYEQERELYAGHAPGAVEPTEDASFIKTESEKVEKQEREAHAQNAEETEKVDAKNTEDETPLYQEDHETEWKRNEDEDYVDSVDPDVVLYDGLGEEKGSHETELEAKVPMQKILSRDQNGEEKI